MNRQSLGSFGVGVVVFFFGDFVCRGFFLAGDGETAVEETFLRLLLMLLRFGLEGSLLSPPSVTDEAFCCDSWWSCRRVCMMVVGANREELQFETENADTTRRVVRMSAQWIVIVVSRVV